MTYIIDQTFKKDLLNYTFRSKPQWSVLASPSGAGKIQLLKDGKELYIAARHRSFRYFASKLPILDMFVTSPYVVTAEGQKIGEIWHPRGEFGYVATINDIPYEYRLHSHYIWSFVRNGRQIGIIKLEMGKSQYTVQVNAEGEDALHILLLLCGCFDRENMAFYPQHIGTNYIPRDKYKERAFWKPEDRGRQRDSSCPDRLTHCGK